MSQNKTKNNTKIKTANELRNAWLSFFASKDHAIISGASLIPENDPTVLFTTAGMHPLVPYLMGQQHPAGKRLTNVQKCVRTGDIDEVGDDSHCTFFEMLGNWSLGDFFKKESIQFGFEFLTQILGLDTCQLAVSVFAGDSDAPMDIESAKVWASLGFEQNQIFYLPKQNNWWGPAGLTGPCGPDTEIFLVGDMPKCSDNCSPACDCGKYLEIWNHVFMEYNKTAEGAFVALSQKNVDTGMGLERTIAVLTGKHSVYETDLFDTAIAKLGELGVLYDVHNKTAVRIILDHIRTATFMIGDRIGTVPSNTDQGYILRRLLRRAIRYSQKLNLSQHSLSKIALEFVKKYEEAYPELKQNLPKIIKELDDEEDRFAKTINIGMQQFDKLVQYLQGDTISGKAAFRLYDTYGFPLEMTQELAKERGLTVNTQDYQKCFEEHQSKSHDGATQKFGGGLQDNSTATTNLHTATHLMHHALKVVLNDDTVNQKGSNITAERLRFDFNFPRPLTQDELKQVQELVNQAIAADVKIDCKEMTPSQAKASGAIGLFDDKYQATVKVYTMGEYSCEICGGPHAQSTGQLGKFEILKEQSSSAGIRRIKAILTNQQNNV